MSTVGRRFFGGIVAVVGGLALAFQFPTAAYAYGDITINAYNFGDDNFRTYVSTELDTNHDGTLQKSEAEAVTVMDVSGKSIKSLHALDYFPKLTKVYASNNQVTYINVLDNPDLEVLDVRNNQLTSIDLSKNTKLKKLYIDNNKLGMLDLTNNGYLEESGQDVSSSNQKKDGDSSCG